MIVLLIKIVMRICVINDMEDDCAEEHKVMMKAKGNLFMTVILIIFKHFFLM